MPEPKIPRFKPPDPEPKEEKTCYCQFCEEYYHEDDMQDVDYEVCSECFDGVVSDARRYSLVVKTILEWADDGCMGSNYTAKLQLASIKTYLDGLK